MNALTATTAPPATQDCWKKIGVWGDSTCAELETVTHCRRCPVYASIGLGLLDRELPSEYRAIATAQISQPKPARTTGSQSALLFRISSEWLSLPVAAFVEVVERRTIHTVPHALNSILQGLVNVRGELLLCVSLSQLLGLVAEATETKPGQSHHARLLVVARDGQRLVFPTDEVFGLHRYHANHLQEVPATVTHTGAPYIKAILPWQRPRAAAAHKEQISVGLLDDELLFYTINRSLA